MEMMPSGYIARRQALSLTKIGPTSKKTKIKDNDWKAVEAAALSLFTMLESLTSDLWHKINKKKEDAVQAGKVKEFLGISKINPANKKLDDAMEVEGDDNETMKSMMGKEIDRKLNRAKAKEKREKRKKLFGRRQNPSAGAKKNWSEWLK